MYSVNVYFPTCKEWRLFLVLADSHESATKKLLEAYPYLKGYTCRVACLETNNRDVFIVPLGQGTTRTLN